MTARVIPLTPVGHVERRDAQRFPFRWVLRYSAKRLGKALSGTGQTLNISATGVLFEPDLPLWEDARVELKIDWPVLRDGRELCLRCHGKVVRIDEGLVGVQFSGEREFCFKGNGKNH